jgi:hypothetical protein
VAQALSFALSRNSQTVDLSTNSISVQSGAQGLDAPGTDLLERRAAGIFGSFVTGLDAQARDIFLPLMLTASGLSGLADLRQQIFNVSRLGTAVRLTVTQADGTMRYIDGYRTGDNGASWESSTWTVTGIQKMGLKLRCPDPWFRGPQISYVFRTTPPQFFPLLPVSLGPSQIIGSVSELNTIGDVPSYPTWTITGPCTQVVATDVDSNRSWTLNATLQPGEQAIVRTDPRLAASGPMVTGPDGSSWWSKLAAPYDLWPLLPEQPQIQVTVTGLTSASSVVADVDPLYESAL